MITGTSNCLEKDACASVELPIAKVDFTDIMLIALMWILRQR